jgi:hypothetical protein
MFIRICSNDFRLPFDINLNLKLMTCKLITSAFMNKHVALHNTVSPIFTGQDWPVKMWLICCHETLLNYYQSKLRNIPEERKSRLLWLHILKWEIEKEICVNIPTRNVCHLVSDMNYWNITHRTVWYFPPLSLQVSSTSVAFLCILTLQLLLHPSVHCYFRFYCIPLYIVTSGSTASSVHCYFWFCCIPLYIVTSGSTASSVHCYFRFYCILCTLLLLVLLHLSVYCYFRFYSNSLCIITSGSTASLCTLLLQLLLHPSVNCYFRFYCMSVHCYFRFYCILL